MPFGSAVNGFSLRSSLIRDVRPSKSLSRSAVNGSREPAKSLLRSSPPWTAAKCTAVTSATVLKIVYLLKDCAAHLQSALHIPMPGPECTAGCRTSRNVRDGYSYIWRGRAGARSLLTTGKAKAQHQSQQAQLYRLALTHQPALSISNRPVQGESRHGADRTQLSHGSEYRPKAHHVRCNRILGTDERTLTSANIPTHRFRVISDDWTTLPALFLASGTKWSSGHFTATSEASSG